MKKIIYIAFALLSLSLASCSKEETENPYEHESAISIVNAEVLFGEEAGEGYVTVESKSDYTVSCSADWLTITKDGSTVNLKASQNNTITGRDAVIMFYCEGDSAKVVAQQKAFAFIKEIPEKLNLNDDSYTNSYEYRAPYSVTVKTSASWISAKMNGENLEISIPKNTSGVARVGKIYLTGTASNSQTDSISVSQYDFQGKVAGRYTITYTTTEYSEVTKQYEDVEKTDIVTLARDESTGEVTLDMGNGFSVPLEFSAENMTLTLYALKYCGSEKEDGVTYYIYTTLVASNVGLMFFGSDFGLVAKIKYVDVDGKQKIRLDWEDNGAIRKAYNASSYIADTFNLYRFTSTPSASTVAGSLYRYGKPYLIKM